MCSSLLRSSREIKLLNSQSSFVELQIHDMVKQDTNIIKRVSINGRFNGYLTLHGEGETDGRKKINFSSADKTLRENYVEECAELYSLISAYFDRYRIIRLILHPDTLSKRLSRKQQVTFLVESLLGLAERVYGIDFICIEPRGGDRQRKILRAEIDDIRIFEDLLNSCGLSNIGLCIDIAQLFTVHGNNGMAIFLKELESIKLPIKEFHVSDVLQNTTVKNRVAMEVGTGSIDWKLILPLMLRHCNDFLIETLGGVKVFQRSKAFLDSLLKGT